MAHVLRLIHQLATSRPRPLTTDEQSWTGSSATATAAFTEMWSGTGKMV